MARLRSFLDSVLGAERETVVDVLGLRQAVVGFDFLDLERQAREREEAPGQQS
jgi:hypothetical protein